MPDNYKTSVPALEKGLEIIELLATVPQSLSLSEVSRKLGRTVAETQKPLKALYELGYAHRNNQGGYFLGHRLFRLAHTYAPYARISEIARPAMQQFAIETTESIHISIRSQDRLLLIEQIQGRALGRFTHQVGSEEDLSTTVSGRIILANLPIDEVDAVFRKEQVGPQNRKRLISQLKRIAKDGYHFAPSSIYQAVFDLGIPIKDSHGATLAGLTTSYIKRKLNPQNKEDILSALEKAKRSIESNL